MRLGIVIVLYLCVVHTLTYRGKTLPSNRITEYPKLGWTHKDRVQLLAPHRTAQKKKNQAAFMSSWSKCFLNSSRHSDSVQPPSQWRIFS